MKRLAVIVLVLMMIVFNMISCYADTQFVEMKEDFTIRSGVCASSTKDDVKRIETENGNSAFDPNTYYGNDYGLSYSILLAGYQGNVTYWFDENNTIEEFQYLLYQQDAYDNIKAGLTQKYGTPMFNKQSYIAGTRIDTAAEKMAILKPSERDYIGWILQYNDCYVMLEMKEISLREAYGMSLYFVNYQILSYEDMEVYQLAVESIEEYVNNSFANDL